jgi:CheY-like chemotaxis protein
MVTTDFIPRLPTPSGDRGAHIVIAEENVITRRKIELAMARLGWTFESAADGVEALSAIERSVDKLGLVLSDVRMPQMNGIELIRVLKSTLTLAHVPVVLIGWPDQEPKARVAACDGFLSKPVSIADLLKLLNL